jgi:hypothetical protein
MRLGSPDILEPFPDRACEMHRRIYLRIRARGEAADVIALGRYLGKTTSWFLGTS